MEPLDADQLCGDLNDESALLVADSVQPVTEMADLAVASPRPRHGAE
jgi:hypothetical protein